MSFDTTSLPISGSVILAGLVYVGACVFVTGPLVATRTIDKSDWNQSCPIAITRAIEAQRTPEKIIPNTDCKSLLGGFMPELGQLCQQYGNPDFGGGTTQTLRRQEALRREAEENRLAAMAANSTSRCDCAASLVAEDRSWAIHAGSFRLITPPAVAHMRAELVGAMQTPLCAG